MSKARKPINEGECKRKKSCKYGKLLSINCYFCDYLGMVGKMRPCPAKDCTVYKRRRQ